MLDVGARGSQLPVTRVTTNGAAYASWTQSGQRLAWSLGPTLYGANTADMLRTAPGGSLHARRPPAPRSP